MNFFSLFSGIAGVGFLVAILTLAQNFGLAIIMEDDDFGIYAYYQSFLMLFLNFIPFGSGLLITFALYKKSDKEFEKFFNVNLFYLLFLTTVFCLVIYVLFKSFFTQLYDSTLMIYVILQAYLSSIILTFSVYLRSKQMLKLYGTHFIFYAFIILVCSYFGYLTSKSIVGVYLSVCIGLFLFSIYTLYLVRKYIGLDLSLEGSYKELKKSLKYGFPVVGGSMGMSLLTQGDRILAGISYSIKDLNTYAIAALLASTFLFVVNNFASAWTAFIAKEMAGKNIEEIYEHYRSKVKLLFLILPLIFIVYLLQYVIYFIFFQTKAPNISLVIMILTSSYGLYLASKFFIAYLNLMNQNKRVFQSTFIGLSVAFSLFYVLDDMNPLYRLSIIVFCGFFIQYFFCHQFTKNYFKKLKIKKN